jgi:hypothetical protein
VVDGGMFESGEDGVVDVAGQVDAAPGVAVHRCPWR